MSNAPQARLTPAQQYILENYRTKTFRQIAADLGRDFTSVQQSFDRLIERGLAERRLRFYNPPWSAAEVRWVLERLGTPGWPIDRIAEKLGRTKRGVLLKLKRLKVKRPQKQATDGTFRLQDLMRIFGTKNHDLVRGWIQSGLLKGCTLPVKAGVNQVWMVYPSDLLEFLEKHRDAYERWRMPEMVGGQPNRWKQLARDGKDPTAGYLTTKSAAARAGLNADTVRRLCLEGKIKAVHLTGYDIHPEEWFIRPEWLQEHLDRKGRPNG